MKTSVFLVPENASYVWMVAVFGEKKSPFLKISGYVWTGPKIAAMFAQGLCTVILFTIMVKQIKIALYIQYSQNNIFLNVF